MEKLNVQQAPTKTSEHRPEHGCPVPGCTGVVTETASGVLRCSVHGTAPWEAATP